MRHPLDTKWPSQAKWRNRQKDNGMCIQCTQPATGGTVRCTSCRAKAKAYGDLRRAAKRAARIAADEVSR